MANTNNNNKNKKDINLAVTAIALGYFLEISPEQNKFEHSYFIQ